MAIGHSNIYAGLRMSGMQHQDYLIPGVMIKSTVSGKMLPIDVYVYMKCPRYVSCKKGPVLSTYRFTCIAYHCTVQLCRKIADCIIVMVIRMKMTTREDEEDGEAYLLVTPQFFFPKGGPSIGYRRNFKPLYLGVSKYPLQHSLNVRRGL